MEIGETAEILIDPRFGYGTIGLPNEKDSSKSIPSGAKVYSEKKCFDIKLFTDSAHRIVFKTN